MVKRIVVGAHYGLRGWVVQRVTAVMIAVYTLFLLAVIAAQLPLDYLRWRGLFTHTWMRVPTFVALVALYLHAWVGMRDILMDYVKPTTLRLSLMVIVIVALVAYTVWTVQILWSL
ncbi:MAG: succinate dehydrogenase, hydrophobic membrane anchor protein [Burkholderiales bacterium]|nr:succinate dehydrogenase, hydrophobic membrane anchor protein [Burkholderiales bacterium]